MLYHYTEIKLIGYGLVNFLFPSFVNFKQTGFVIFVRKYAE